MKTADITKQFEIDGYYLAKGVFDMDELRALEEDFDQIVWQLQQSGEEINAKWPGEPVAELSRPDDIVIHTHNVHRYSRIWLDAMLKPEFLNASAAIVGEDIVLHHSKLFQKPAEEGAPFPVHQDWSYFPTELDTMFAGVIHISDATEEMGCFKLYPGSHQLGRLQSSSGRAANSLMDQYPIENALTVEAEAGDVLFFHYCTLHGSLPNRSQTTRKTVLVQMYSGQDRVIDGNEHVDEKLVLQGRNHCVSRSAAGQQS